MLGARMAKAAKGVRLSPPLMFAFREANRAGDSRQHMDERDTGGDRVLATRRSLRAAVSENQLRAQLARDLDNLLNTTNFESANDLGPCDHVRRSIVNYGLPDIVHRTIEEAGTEFVADEILTAVVTYEPRLIRKSVRVIRDTNVDPGANNIRFLVSGEMSCDPVAVPVQFVADLEVVSGKLAVNKR